MGIPRLFPELAPPAPTLSVFAPADTGQMGQEHRITNPGFPTNADLTSLYQGMASGIKEDLPVISDAERKLARESWSIAEFYDRVLLEWQSRRLAASKVTAGNLQKERQTIRCFADWEKTQAPPGWPWPTPFRGLPVSYLTSTYIERWLTARLGGGMSAGTLPSRWSHLRTVLNWAVRLKVLDRCPRISMKPLIETHRQTLEEVEDDDLVPTTYSNPQLEAVYRQLGGDLDLQTAWVLGANCGPRTFDLFNLRWGINVRVHDSPELIYKAKKTGKRHWVPLADCVVDHLRRLIRQQAHLDPSAPQGLVFPRLTSATHADPEKSHAARARNARIKFAIAGAGIDCSTGDYTKPWQVLRATCNSRLNNHRSGAGRLITHGKDADVSSAHYWDHRDMLIEAVASLPQPAAFVG